MISTVAKKFEPLAQLQWTKGAGDGKRTACVNSLAVLLDAQRRGLTHAEAMAEFSDNAACICPVIRRLSIRINDCVAYWPDAAEATAWMRATAPRLLATHGTLELTRMRAFLCADAAIRELAPSALDFAAKSKPALAEWAMKLRSCEPVTGPRTARAACAVVNDARTAAYATYATYAADAARAAAGSAYAATYAAEGAARAAASVEYAAEYAAAGAARAAAGAAAGAACAAAGAEYAATYAAVGAARAAAGAEYAAAGAAEGEAYAAAGAEYAAAGAAGGAVEITRPIMLALLERLLAAKESP